MVGIRLIEFTEPFDTLNYKPFFKDCVSQIIFILKTICFILHTSSSFVHIKSTVNIQILKGLLHGYSIIKTTNIYLTIFMAINTNIMNKTIKTFYINY